MCLWCFDVIPHVVFSFSVRALFLAICFNHTQLPFVSFKRLIKPPLRIQPRGNLIWLDVKSVTSLGLNINQLSLSFLHIPVFNQVSPLWPSYTPLYSGDMTSPRQLNNGAFSVVVILVICSTTLHLPPHHNINSRNVARQNVGINKLSAMAYLAFYKKLKHEAYLRSNSFTTRPAAACDHGAAKALILTKLQCPGFWMVQAGIERNNEIRDRVSWLSPKSQGHISLHRPAMATSGIVLQSSCASQLKN